MTLHHGAVDVNRRPPTRQWACTVALFLIVVPSVARAQTVATSFEELPQVLKKGETVVVTDASGQQTKGKVADVSPSALVVFIPETRIFSVGTVTEIRTTDPLWNGAFIGGAVGTGLAIWDYLIDPSEPGNAAVFAVAIGLGTAVGAGIDALVNRGGKVRYRSPRQTRGVIISPVFRIDRRSALISVRLGEGDSVQNLRPPRSSFESK